MDLKGKRLSLDEPGSGTLVDARLILAAYGLTEKDMKAEYLKTQQAADKLKDGALDAFFSVSGWPNGAISELAVTSGIDLVPMLLMRCSNGDERADAASAIREATELRRTVLPSSGETSAASLRCPIALPAMVEASAIDSGV